jgi:hypothetical protein
MCIRRIESILTVVLGLALVFSCGKRSIPQAATYDFPSPVDTKDHPITLQERNLFAIDGVYATNKFRSARLNDFVKENDSLYKAVIEPENTPINGSPWFAFKIWADETDTIRVKLEYTFSRHRYVPKLSYDGNLWRPIAAEQMQYVDDSINLIIQLPVSQDTLWVSAQEIFDSNKVKEWSTRIAANPFVTMSEAGKSKGGRSLYFLNINKNSTKKKDVIVILSRQHPPEVTGFMAMQAFVEEILNNPSANDFLDQYQVLVYPLLNPDGVDNGHWRHNLGGIDLNRDWAYYNQPETRQIANHIVRQIHDSGGRVVLGLDFHSTQKDVFYTLPDEVPRAVIPGFKKAWLSGIEENIANYSLNESPDPIGPPVTKFWFYTQFKAEGVTYEIGDETPRDFIRLKGKVSARQMMKVLMENRGE